MHCIKQKKIAFLPRSLWQRLLRRRLSFPRSLPAAMQFSLVHSFKDYEQAFALLYPEKLESLLSLSLPLANNQGLLYLLKPDTQIVVVKVNSVVVAAATIAIDGPLGLPIDARQDVSKSRASSRKRLGELCNLAVLSHYDFMYDEIFLCILKFSMELSRKYLGIDLLVLRVFQYQLDFFQALFGRKAISLLMDRDEDANQLDIILNLSAIELEVKVRARFYRGWGKIFEFFFHREFKNNFNYPCNIYNIMPASFLPSFALKQLQSQFKRDFQKLTQGEKIWISKHYPGLINNVSEAAIRNRQRYFRFPFDYSVVVRTPNRSEKGYLLNASRSGLQLKINKVNSYFVGEEVKIDIIMGEKANMFTLIAKICWQDESGRLGLEITSNHLKFTSVVEAAERQFRKANLQCAA